jgi:hypothetical protein
MKRTTMLVSLGAVVASGVLAASAQAAAPVSTTPPTISGTAQRGKTLTASSGTWSHTPTTFFYRWQRCAADATACANIDNAAAKTYVLTAADVDHTVRVMVTASNKDGQTSANSQPTDVVSATTAPKNTAPPAISGTTQVGEEVTAGRGTWTGGTRSYVFQWQRCDVTGEGCADVAGATGASYGVRAADRDHTLRVVVTATNLAGSTSASSDATGVVQGAAGSSSPPVVATTRRPTVVILSVRFVGQRVFARFRACDDSRKNLRFLERDSKPGTRSYSRRFRTLVPPRTCSVLSRSWMPASRFRHGRLTIRLWASDVAGLTSPAATRTVFR